RPPLPSWSAPARRQAQAPAALPRADRHRALPVADQAPRPAPLSFAGERFPTDRGPLLLRMTGEPPVRGRGDAPPRVGHGRAQRRCPVLRERRKGGPMEGPEITFAEATIDNGSFGTRTVRF